MITFISFIIITVFLSLGIQLVLLWGLFRLFKTKEASLQKTAIIFGVSTATLLTGGLFISLLPLPPLPTSIGHFLIIILSFIVFHLLAEKYYQETWIKNILVYSVFSILSFILVTALIMGFRAISYTPLLISSDSMSPTLVTDEYILTQKYSMRYYRGDIISYQREGSPVIKLGRIIGLPNERITIRGGQLLLNGIIFNESAYLDENVKTPGDISVPLATGQYFVLPDNRTFDPTTDPSLFKIVKKKEIISKYIKKLPAPKE